MKYNLESEFWNLVKEQKVKKKHEIIIFKGKINMKLNPNLEPVDQLDWLGNIFFFFFDRA